MSNVRQLRQRILVANVASRPHGLVHQKITVPGENDTSLIGCNRNQIGIFPGVVPERIEAGKAQITRQSPEVGVRRKPSVTVRLLRHQMTQCREDGNPVAFAQEPVQFDHFTVDQHQSDFGMRHAERFDNVLDALTRQDDVDKSPPAPMQRQEIRQLGIKPELGQRIPPVFRGVPSRSMPLLVSADQLRLGDDMSPHRLFKLRLVRLAKVWQNDVQSVQLVKITMSPDWRTRAAVTGSLPVVHTFHASRRQ